MISYPIAFLLSLLSGILLFLSFPPCDYSLLIWIAPLPLFAALWGTAKATKKSHYFLKFLLGLTCGVSFYGGSFWWINEVTSLGYVPMVLYLALYIGLWGLIVGTIFRPHYTDFPTQKSPNNTQKQQRTQWAYKDMSHTLYCTIMAACTWVSLDWLRSLGKLGFAWNTLGSALPLYYAQAAEYVGSLGLSFLPVLVAGVLWNTGRRITLSVLHDGRRTVQWDFLAICAIFCALFVWGSAKTKYIPVEKTHALRLLLVQQNTPQKVKWDPTQRASILKSYEQAVKTALEQRLLKALASSPVPSSQLLPSTPPPRFQTPDWVIFPESSMPWPIYRLGPASLPLEDQPVDYWAQNYWEPLSQEEGPFTLITGCDEVFFNPETKKLSHLFNTLRIYPAGQTKSPISYKKAQLVPFGEFIPWRESLPILEKAFSYSAGISMGMNYREGKSRQPLTIMTRNVPVSIIPSICFEDTVPGLLRQFVRTETPQVIVNITNDGWFNKSWGNEQHLRNAQLRAIELRRPLIRAANTGITTVITAQGTMADPRYPEEGTRELRDKDGSPFFAGTLFATLELPLNPPMTLYAQWGDWFCIQCTLLMIFGFSRPLIIRKQTRTLKRGVLENGVFKKTS